MPELRKEAAFGVFSYDDLETVFEDSQGPHDQEWALGNAKKHFALSEDWSATENVFKAVLGLAKAAK